MQVTDTSCVVAASDQVSCDLSGEATILNLKNGTYYGLDAVGARIWSLLQQPRSVAEIREAIVAEYDVTPARCQADIIDLISQLSEAGLVDIV